MRLMQKKRVLQAIVSMKEAHGFVQEQCGQQSAETVYDMLVQLQEMAVEIGNTIEAEVEDVKELISELEIYCEQIYQCSCTLEDCLSVTNYNRDMLHQLENIEHAISEIKVKIKVAFFPYKFSMWDSLESIWEAACNDKECECQVVPIPYFTKNEKNEFSELHYEGKYFEKVCSVIDYNQYFLEKEQPDIMYIHNPYDQYNSVTMVEPQFFSDELKKHGGILVYVPYYMSGGCMKYENMDIAYGKGAVKSDYIIVQSKALKEAYLYWGFPERRILALGSPKIDAIYKCSVKRTETDDEWKCVTEGKKVVLLNTSIGTFLNREGWLKQIKEMAETVLQNDNMALIWRPHPLLQDTVKTLGKHNEDQYEQLMTFIAEAENGMIDCNADARSAINASHAMISDYSSLVLQYTFTGKPVLLLNGSGKKSPKHLFCDFLQNYFLEDGVSVENFLDMIQRGEDPKKAERLRTATASIENGDGTCGAKVHQTILQKLAEHIV